MTADSSCSLQTCLRSAAWYAETGEMMTAGVLRQDENDIVMLR